MNTQIINSADGHKTSNKSFSTAVAGDIQIEKDIHNLNKGGTIDQLIQDIGGADNLSTYRESDGQTTLMDIAAGLNCPMAALALVNAGFDGNTVGAKGVTALETMIGMANPAAPPLGGFDNMNDWFNAALTMLNTQGKALNINIDETSYNIFSDAIMLAQKSGTIFAGIGGNALPADKDGNPGRYALLDAILDLYPGETKELMNSMLTSGRSPLEQAIITSYPSDGDKTLMQYLVSKGADLSVAGPSGKTPYSYAKSLGQTDCANWLLDQS